MLSNNGLYSKPTTIKRIINLENNEVIYQNSNKKEQMISEESADIITNTLQRIVDSNYLSMKIAKPNSITIAGKTVDAITGKEYSINSTFTFDDSKVDMSTAKCSMNNGLLYITMKYKKEEVKKTRFSTLKKEMDEDDEVIVDDELINDEVDNAADRIMAIIRAEHAKCSRTLDEYLKLMEETNND
jgi:hypothetical protein